MGESKHASELKEKDETENKYHCTLRGADDCDYLDNGDTVGGAVLCWEGYNTQNGAQRNTSHVAFPEKKRLNKNRCSAQFLLLWLQDQYHAVLTGGVQQ